ncbi:TolC family outer membrane protein [Herbaspirillum sp. WKF16]|jgi:outer membrane protein|uniref:TolC family outer membrane protein n=1 Tax=Herbaspirillum sp. WKF16 TaxID=3028312 RepID=UPI0023A9BBF4|nr:TolC family outer membrane protein [Herbaspirillum sp. WKF16]WDZ96624.1 TolC family outer membrane protein [Herbaspirillum sp. WKF16]
MRSALIVSLLAALATPAAGAADLLQVYQLALANDPVYTSARYALAAGREKDTQGRAGLLPAISVGGSYTRSDQNFDSTNNSYALQLTQPLLRLANWETYKQGKLSVASSEAQFAQAQQDLILRCAQAYFDVLAAQDALSFLAAQKIAISEQLASAKRNFEIGTSTITDTNEAQARYDLANAQEIAAQNDLEVALSKLQQIIGQAPAPLSVLRPGVKLSAPQPAQIDTWIASAQADNYAVVGQQVALEIAQSEIKRNRAGHAPTVDLVAGRNFTDQTSVRSPYLNLRGYSNSVGVQWNIPLFSGFATGSKVDEAIALADKARSDLENARRTAVLNARQSYLGVVNGLSQVKAYEAAEVSSQSSLDSNKLGYQVGVRINIDVLNAQQQLYSTRRDLARARYDTLMNGLKLKAAAGALREDDLAQVNALLGGPQQ